VGSVKALNRVIPTFTPFLHLECSGVSVWSLELFWTKVAFWPLLCEKISRHCQRTGSSSQTGIWKGSIRASFQTFSPVASIQNQHLCHAGWIRMIRPLLRSARTGLSPSSGQWRAFKSSKSSGFPIISRSLINPACKASSRYQDTRYRLSSNACAKQEQ
jgi:hypothetical protein